MHDNDKNDDDDDFDDGVSESLSSALPGDPPICVRACVVLWIDVQPCKMGAPIMFTTYGICIY